MKFDTLNRKRHLKPFFKGYRPPGGLHDAVAELLAECSTPGELARVASAFGLPDRDIREHGKRAGYKRFSMKLSERIRAICRRLRRARRFGLSITPGLIGYVGNVKDRNQWRSIARRGGI